MLRVATNRGFSVLYQIASTCKNHAINDNAIWVLLYRASLKYGAKIVPYLFIGQVLHALNKHVYFM